MKDFRTVTLADQVFERLESDIIQGVYPRGEVLTELRLVEQLNVSRTPIREALCRLEHAEHRIRKHRHLAMQSGIEQPAPAFPLVGAEDLAAACVRALDRAIDLAADGILLVEQHDQQPRAGCARGSGMAAARRPRPHGRGRTAGGC